MNDKYLTGEKKPWQSSLIQFLFGYITLPNTSCISPKNKINKYFIIDYFLVGCLASDIDTLVSIILFPLLSFPLLSFPLHQGSYSHPLTLSQPSYHPIYFLHLFYLQLFFICLSLSLLRWLLGIRHSYDSIYNTHYFTILYFTILYFTILYFTILYFIALLSHSGRNAFAFSF